MSLIKRRPLVAILLAFYKGERFVAEQIRSIEDQTYRDWILIMCDDGVDDSATSSLDPFLIDKKVIRIGKGSRCSGLVQNFSELLGWALENTAADIFMFCDQDDVWFRQKIQVSVEKILQMGERMEGEVPLLMHADCVVVDERLGLINESLDSYQGVRKGTNLGIQTLLVQNNVTGCTAAVNRRLAELAYPVPREAVWHDWWLALIAASIGHIAYEPAPLLMYRQSGSNVLGATRYSSWQEVDLGRIFNTTYTRRQHNFAAAAQAGALLQRLRDRGVPARLTALRQIYFFSRYFDYSPLTRLALWMRYRYGRDGWLGKAKFVLGTLFASKTNSPNTN